jgi:hypothetical protein
MNIQKKAVDLTDLAISIIILGIIVSIGATILINMRDTRLTDLSSVTTNNESFTISTTGTNLAHTWGISVSNIVNNSGYQLNTANYSTSVSSSTGQISVANLTSMVPYGTSLNATYSWYNTSRADWSLPNNASVGLAEYGNWFKILVIVGVASVVLALIFMAFGRSSTSNEGGIGGSY